MNGKATCTGERAILHKALFEERVASLESAEAYGCFDRIEIREVRQTTFTPNRGSPRTKRTKLLP